MDEAFGECLGLRGADSRREVAAGVTSLLLKLLLLQEAVAVDGLDDSAGLLDFADGSESLRWRMACFV